MGDGLKHGTKPGGDIPDADVTSSTANYQAFDEQIMSMCNTEPCTTSEIYDTVGKNIGKSRFQTENRLKTLTIQGELKAKKPKERASWIYYKTDY